MNSPPIILAVGLPGSGKSRWARDIVRATRPDQAVVVHDVVCDWQRWGPWPRHVLLFSRDHDPAEVARHNAPCTLVLDEATLSFPRGRGALDPLVELAVTARHVGVALLLLTQRAVNVDITAQSVISHLAVFQQVHPRDLAWLRSIWWDCPDPANLKPGEHYFKQFRSLT